MHGPRPRQDTRVPPVCTSLLGLLARWLEGGLRLVQEDPGSESETGVCSGLQQGIPLSSSLPGGVVVEPSMWPHWPPPPGVSALCPLSCSQRQCLRKAPPSVVLGVAGVKGSRQVAAPLREV